MCIQIYIPMFKKKKIICEPICAFVLIVVCVYMSNLYLYIYIWTYNLHSR